MAYKVEILLRREAVAKAFGDPDAIKAFEEQQELLAGHPDEIALAQATATDAQGKANAVKAAPVVTFGATAAFSGERVLGGGPGVSVDVATPGQANIINDPTLNEWSATGLSATATASDHSIPIDIGGTTYYIRLSTTP